MRTERFAGFENVVFLRHLLSAVRLIAANMAPPTGIPASYLHSNSGSPSAFGILVLALAALRRAVTGV